METAEIANAIAYLSEQIAEVRVNQAKYKEDTEKSLKEWSTINLSLTECLQSQAEDTREYIGHQQELSRHLLTLGESAQTLGVSSEKLKNSLSALTQHLEEKQSLQLTNLSKNNQDLKTSMDSLMLYLEGDQAKRLKVLEEGMKSLIEIMEQIPGVAALTTGTKKKGLNFDLSSLSMGSFFNSLFTAVLIFLIWQFSGTAKQITRAEERTIWSIMKLEKIEQYLGI